MSPTTDVASKGTGQRRLLVDDSPVTSFGDDALGHRDVATLLKHVLQDWLGKPTPLHVALYGPWGGGKSGVIALLKKELAADLDLAASVWLVDFSLWRFGAENVRRGLLLFLDGADGLGTNTGLAKRLSEVAARTNATTSISWKRFFAWLAVSVAVIGAYVLVPPTGPASSSLERLFSQLINLGVVLPVALGVLFGIAKLHLQTNVTEGSSTPPPDRADQFKAEFERLLAAARERGTQTSRAKWKEPRKLVLVFDDLDRVPPSLAWEVLTTIKTFMDAPNCVYIVPCDRDAVVDAMKAESGPHLEARAIDFLDKFFQVSFVLPETFPREFRQISDRVCRELELGGEIGTIAVAGFSRTPRALKVFLNQVSLLADFIGVRNARMGELPTEGFLGKVAKVHAIRVLWPTCGRIAAERPTLMEALERLAQGIESQEATDAVTVAKRLMTPGDDTFCRGLREFLVATLGTVVGRDAQSAIKLSEAMWAEASGDLGSMATYLATGDVDGIRRLFEKGGVGPAVGVARDVFNAEVETSTPEMLVGWTAVLLQAFFDGKSSSTPSDDLVNLALEWAYSPRVRPLLANLPPEPLIRAMAVSTSPQATYVGQKMVDLAFRDEGTPLSDYTSAILRGLSLARTALRTKHPDVAQKLRERLGALITASRGRGLAMLSALGQGAPGNDWGLWWDDTVSIPLMETVTGATSPAEDTPIVDLVARPDYQPSDSERRTSVSVAARILAAHPSPSIDGSATVAFDLINRVALTGDRLELLSEKDASVLSVFAAKLGDAKQRLTALTAMIRLSTPSSEPVKAVVREDALRKAMPVLQGPEVSRLVDLVIAEGLGLAAGWVQVLLERCVEMRDIQLFVSIAEKSKNSQAVGEGLEAALRTDQAFWDTLAGKAQMFTDAAAFATTLEKRVTSAGPDVASTMRLGAALQSLSQKPELSQAIWHTIALRLEQGVADFSDPASAQALRRVISATTLTWLPDADQKHLAVFATAVVRGVAGQPNDPAETIQAKLEAGLVFESLCAEAQLAAIANGIAHVLAWPTLSATVVSQLVAALTSRPRLLALVTDEAIDAVALTKEGRADEGKAFLEGLLQQRPPRPPRAVKEKPGARPKPER